MMKKDAAKDDLASNFVLNEPADSLVLPKKYILFDNTKTFEVRSFALKTTKESSGYPDTLQCKDWKISKEDVSALISHCKSISGPEWHHEFDVLPCIAEGEIFQNGNIFKYEINAGSWMGISNGDTGILLGNFNKKDRKYFLSEPDVE